MSSVSVIIPCYNYAHFLRECIESVLSQPGVVVQILIIDDASSDNTAEVAAELAAHNSCVEYRRHEKNWGHIATYNDGLDWANGDYIVLLSADDLLTPGSLKRATQLMDDHPEVGFVYGGCVLFDTNQPMPQPRVPSLSSNWKIYNSLDWLEYVCEVGWARIWSPEVLVRTSLQHKLGGYRPELPHMADNEMWMRFAVHAPVGHILDADQAYHRMHTQNMHYQFPAGTFKDVLQSRATFDIVFLNNRDLIPGWERLRKKVDIRLAREALQALGHSIHHGELAQTPVLEIIKFIASRHRGKFFDLEFLRMYLGFSNKILRWVGGKFGLV
jgi:glycosyltransferase involved in cell wall biosynthesis